MSCRFTEAHVGIVFLAIVLAGCPAQHEGALPEAGARDAGDPALEPDSGATDAAGEGAVDDPVERSVALVLAAPDLPPQFICLGAFATDASGAPLGDPVIAGGPFGVPDPTDPARRRLISGFPYGAVVRLPLRRHDSKYFVGHKPIGYVVDDVQPREFAGSGNDSETCKRAWAAARDVAGRQLDMSSLQVGDSWIAGVSGCIASSPAPECGGGSNLQTTATRADLTPVLQPVDGGELLLALQVANFSLFPAFQKIDMYLQPVRSQDGGNIPDGEPTALTMGDLSGGDIGSSAVVVHLASADAGDALLLAVPHGAAPCAGGPGCSTVAIPIDPYRARYAPASGGATGASWSGHQVLALFGRPPATLDESAAGRLFLGMFDAALP